LGSDESEDAIRDDSVDSHEVDVDDDGSSERYHDVVVFQSGNIDHWRGSHPAFTGRRESMTASIALKACFPDFSPPLLNTNAQSSKTTSRKARMAVTSPSSRRDLGASCADPLGLKSGKQAFKAMEVTGMSLPSSPCGMSSLRTER
jgi:hypothetical protein